MHDGLPVMLAFMCLPFSWSEIITLPNFHPNEYFWSTHGRDGEQKWETYARVMRDIMADAGRYKKDDVMMESKFEYRKLLKEGKITANFNDKRSNPNEPA